jgi:FMN phosphatase YigB (HAD superfamily)
MIKAVLFDIDGVIIRHEKYFSHTLSTRFFLDPVEVLNEFYGSDINRDCDRGLLDPLEAIAPFLERIGWTEGSRNYLLAQYEFESRYIDTDLLGRIKRLNGSGIECYIASNQNHLRKDFLIERLGIRENFAGAFFSSELGFIKPEDGYWRRVIERVGNGEGRIGPNEMLFLDDLEANVVSARDFGIEAIQVNGIDDIERGFKAMHRF